MPSAVDGVQIAKATTAELDSNCASALWRRRFRRLQNGATEPAAIENLEKPCSGVSNANSLTLKVD